VRINEVELTGGGLVVDELEDDDSDEDSELDDDCEAEDVDDEVNEVNEVWVDEVVFGGELK
jgi:hypothetical protein